MNKSPEYRTLAVVVLVILACTYVKCAAEQAVKVLLVGKDRDHPYRTHEYMATCELLANCLKQTPGVETVVSNGWPKQHDELTGVSAVVLYTCNGGDVFLSGQHRKNVGELLKNGVGLTAIHWGTGASKDVGDVWQQALGGWFSTDFSEYLVRTAKLQQADNRHPICRGWNEYDLRDEYYIKLKFQPKAYPIINATIDGQEHVVGWTYERPESNGGRSFGFVCGHFHDNFGKHEFRQAIVNGILWTAGMDLPEGGASCEITPVDMELPPDTRQTQ